MSIRRLLPDMRYLAFAAAFCAIAYGGFRFAVNERAAGTALDSPTADNSAARALAASFESIAGFEYDPPVPGSYRLPVIKPAPDGVLLDHTGQSVRFASRTAGKYTLVSFVYLNCADAEGCPLAMATLWKIFDGSKTVPGLRDELQLATISFDPTRDTPEALGMIADTIKADKDAGKKIAWHFFTPADDSSLRPLMAGFGQTISHQKGSNTINHLLRLFLVDPAGQIRNVYGLGSIDPRLIVTDVQTLLMAEGKALQ